MSIQELKDNKAVMDIVKKFTSDKLFMKKCEFSFKKIFEDGKVDGDDIPLIINLVLMIYKNQRKIKIKKAVVKEVFMLLICELLDKFKGDSTIDLDLIVMMLEPQIDLLFLSVNIPKLSCCGSKPQDDEKAVMTKIKLTKLEKKQKQNML